MNKTEMISAKTFMQHYGIDIVDVNKVAKSFANELIKAKKGETSSVCFGPSNLMIDADSLLIKENLDLIAIDIGGTNFKAAKCKMNSADKSIEFSNVEIFKTPGSDFDLSSEQFFKIISNEILELSKDIKEVSVGISAGLKGESTSDRDLLLDEACKELRISSLAGCYFNKSLKRNLLPVEKFINIKTVNDTTAALLSNLTSDNYIEYDLHIGVVLGTGFNLCFTDNSRNDCSYEDIFVTEAGCFNKISRGYIDNLIDIDSELPGDHVFEKMISGKYIPKLVNKCIEIAKENGLISSSTTSYFNDGADVSNVLMSEAVDHDHAFVKEICKILTGRIADLVAAMILGIISIKDHTENVHIVFEGSTVNKLPGVLDKIDADLKKELSGYNIKYYIDDKDVNILKGAAKNAIM